MPLSSTQRRRKVDERLDAVFHALGDRTRRALLAHLARAPAMITQLAQPFAMSLPAVSRHIRVLEEAGLIVRSVDGRVHRCTLNPAGLRSAEGWMRHYRRFWEASLDSLARYLEKQ